MSSATDTGHDDDHYLGLAGANLVATEALLALRDNLADVVEARAMMCVHGQAGLGKTLSVNAALRALAPAEVCRVQFRARPTPRDIRHVLFEALGVGGSAPTRPIEFDALLKDVLAERFRVLVCDEAQWLSRECFELWRHLGSALAGLLGGYPPAFVALAAVSLVARDDGARDGAEHPGRRRFPISSIVTGARPAQPREPSRRAGRRGCRGR